MEKYPKNPIPNPSIQKAKTAIPLDNWPSPYIAYHVNKSCGIFNYLV
jgi:hypothetical protein